MSNQIRVRFAPSPSGFLHIGGARTALYNWLYARNRGGQFILRIEDTDQSRSTEEAIEAICDALRFLGLNWDEGPGEGGEVGPYRQTARIDKYLVEAKKLVEQDKAYWCYCTPEELKERRKTLLKSGKPPRYDRRCLALSDEEKEQYLKKGQKCALRFRIPEEGTTAFHDSIRGDVSFENKEISDFVILRSDNTPTYNLAVVVDDALMQISHVIRGEDHLSNTPKQILLYQALGFEVPQFAHLPMIVGADRTPLSKRHGAIDVGEFRIQGYLKEALVNYIAILGWSYDDATTLFSIPELIEKFSLERVSTSPALFDIDKLKWMNGQYIRQMNLTELTRRCLPFLEEAGLIKQEPDDERFKWLEKIIALEQERVKKLEEVAQAIDFFFADQVEYDAKSVEKVLKRQKDAQKVLKLAEERLDSLTDFKRGSIEETLRELQEKLELKPKLVFQPVRVAVTGRMVSPPLFETIELLGKEKTTARLKAVQTLLTH